MTPALPAAAAAAAARVTALTTLSPLLVSTTSSWVCQSLLAWLSCGKKSKGMIVGNSASISVLSDVFCFLLANTLWFINLSQAMAAQLMFAALTLELNNGNVLQKFGRHVPLSFGKLDMTHGAHAI